MEGNYSRSLPDCLGWGGQFGRSDPSLNWSHSYNCLQQKEIKTNEPNGPMNQWANGPNEQDHDQT